MEDETPTSDAVEETAGAPGTDAASEENGAPATPPEGFIETKRYEDLRSNHDRINSLVDRARQGDSEALKELTGFDFAEDEEGPALEDEEEQGFQDPRVDQLLAQQAQQQEQAVLNDVSGHIDTLLTEAKVELPQRLKNAILSEAWLRGGGAQIKPETTVEVVKEWVDEYKQLERTAGDRYIASKRAPHVSAGGTGVTQEDLPLDATHAQRVAFMNERLQLASEQ